MTVARLTYIEFIIFFLNLLYYFVPDGKDAVWPLRFKYLNNTLPRNGFRSFPDEIYR